MPVAARLSYRSLGAEARAARGFGVAFRAVDASGKICVVKEAFTKDVVRKLCAVKRRSHIKQGRHTEAVLYRLEITLKTVVEHVTRKHAK